MTTLLLGAAAVWRTIGSVAAALLILLAMITVHEFGHYVAGKILKFRIDEFAIGFGPKIFKRLRKNGEVFSVRLLPLGGFCAFHGEDDDDPDPAAFNNKKPWRRIIVLFSGALMNFLLALLVIVVNLSCFGQVMMMTYEVRPDVRVDPEFSFRSGDVILRAGGKNVFLATDLMDAVKYKSGGDKVSFLVLRKDEDGKYRKREIEVILRAEPNIRNLESTAELYECLGVAPHVSVAESRNPSIRKGDRIGKIDGVPVYDAEGIAAAIAGKSAGETAEIELLRGGSGETVTVVLGDRGGAEGADGALAALGIDAGESEYEMYGASMKFGFFETIGRSFAYSFRIAGTIFTVLGQLLTGKLGVSALGGPVTTIGMTSKMVALGWDAMLEITAFIGVNLAVFNLLPIPALDGSRIVFTIIEWIRRKPVSRKIEGAVHFAGFVILIGFALLVDILQLF